jgi:dTDP-4-amino-4,6-dideoxygalactose transaminase
LFSLSAAVRAGARPIFIDIEARNRNIERALTPRTRTILPGPSAGMACAVEFIDRIAGTHGLPIVGPRTAVGAGAVVARDLEGGVVAMGVAARVARRIEAADRWPTAFSVNMP